MQGVKWGTPASSIIGLTPNQLLFGASDGTVASSPDLTYDLATDTFYLSSDTFSLLGDGFIATSTGDNYIAMDDVNGVVIQSVTEGDSFIQIAEGTVFCSGDFAAATSNEDTSFRLNDTDGILMQADALGTTHIFANAGFIDMEAENGVTLLSGEAKIEVGVTGNNVDIYGVDGSPGLHIEEGLVESLSSFRADLNIIIGASGLVSITYDDSGDETISYFTERTVVAGALVPTHSITRFYNGVAYDVLLRTH